MTKKRILKYILTFIFVSLVTVIPCYGLEDNTDRFVAISAGHSFATALTSTGNVWTWGYTYFGLPDGTHKYTPVQVPISNVKAIASGFDGTLALKDDGTVWAWGNNVAGQLGDGTNTASLTPVKVKSLTNVVEISTGTVCSYALKDDGTVWAWGANWYGQLGDGSLNNSNVPVQVKGLYNISILGAGGPYAIRDDGSAWAWGDNTIAQDSKGNKVYGALGDGYPGIRTPFRMENLSNVKSIASGSAVSYAIEDNGSLWAWGLENQGLLGNGMVLPDSYVKIPPCILLTKVQLDDVVAVSGGSVNSLALTSNGSVWVWGIQSNGQVYLVPMMVDGLSNIIAIGEGGNGAYVALKNDCTIWTWGDNSVGQLGDGNNNSTEPYRMTPLKILGDSSSVLIVTPTKIQTPSIIPEQTPPDATGIVIPGATTNTDEPQSVGFDFELVGLTGAVLVVSRAAYQWMVKKQ